MVRIHSLLPILPETQKAFIMWTVFVNRFRAWFNAETPRQQQSRVIAVASGFALAMLLMLVLFMKFCGGGPAPIITNPAPGTMTITLPATTVTPNAAAPYIEDDANAKLLLEENRRLRVQVKQLTETIAKYKVVGTGTVAAVPTMTITPLLQPASPETTPTVYEYKDWRLHFVSDNINARYQLTQTFEVLSTTGRARDGSSVALVRLFEIGPDGTRLPIPDVKTVNVVADDTRPHWSLGLTIQAGAAYVITPTGQSGAAGIVAAQWLKRGRTEAAEDSSVSLLSPALVLSETVQEVGILPISINLGQMPYQPFKDLWLSPVVSFNPTSKTFGRWGVSVTASF